MRKKFILLLLTIALVSCQSNDKKGDIIKIAFGSCSNQNKPQPLLKVASQMRPNAFVYLGDNIYGDTYSMDTLRYKYQLLAQKSEFQELKSSTQLFATWDDHDYGWNDIGRHYPFKEESKEIFLDFWDIDKNSDRRKHEGIYDVQYLKFNDFKIQLILLDTRTFRDDLVKNDHSGKYKNDYKPNLSKDSTFLGVEQWKWLDKTLSQPADLRIVASSNQFSHEYNGWESWTNVPVERERFLNLIKRNKANGVIFISGDVHWGEISKLETKNLYPIYDVTSSGITEEWRDIEPNKNRVGKAFSDNNIGLITIDTSEKDPIIQMALYNSEGNIVTESKIRLSEIMFK